MQTPRTAPWLASCTTLLTPATDQMSQMMPASSGTFSPITMTTSAPATPDKTAWSARSSSTSTGLVSTRMFQLVYDLAAIASCVSHRPSHLPPPNHVPLTLAALRRNRPRLGRPTFGHATGERLPVECHRSTHQILGLHSMYTINDYDPICPRPPPRPLLRPW
jgi:hypothetical protein